MTATFSNSVLIFALVFIGCLWWYALHSSGHSGSSVLEAFTSSSSSSARCPDLLVQKGAQFFLYNSKLARIPGVNPIVFDSLENYSEFLNWQRGAGIRCPVLFAQYTYDVHGEPVYKIRPSPTDLQGGLPPSAPFTKLVDASHDDAPYNMNSFPGIDQTSYYQGSMTPQDVLDQETSMHYSGNPMDPNWGGAAYTQTLVDAGYYKKDGIQSSEPPPVPTPEEQESNDVTETEESQ